jgi:glycosyltransferase involved in cell wall biosynthesis
MESSVITFIIPSINRESLTQSINSLINQTNPNWRCIIIYDGVDGKLFNDPRIETINIDKIGSKSFTHGMSGLVRNEGLKLCKTEWIGFLDDDDTLHPDYVNTLFSKYYELDFIIWRMKFSDGLVIPRTDKISFGDVGISIAYKNKYGQFDYVNFFKRHDTQFNTDQRVYQPQIGTWESSTLSYNQFQTSQQRYIVDATQVLECNTDFLEEGYNDLFKQLLVSDEIYWLYNQTTSVVKPLTIKTNSLQFKTGVNNKLIQYTIEFYIGQPYKFIF